MFLVFLIYLEIRKGMYIIPIFWKLANDELKYILVPYDYNLVTHTPTLWNTILTNSSIHLLSMIIP